MLREKLHVLAQCLLTTLRSPLTHTWWVLKGFSSPLSIGLRLSGWGWRLYLCCRHFTFYMHELYVRFSCTCCNTETLNRQNECACPVPRHGCFVFWDKWICAGSMGVAWISLKSFSAASIPCAISRAFVSIRSLSVSSLHCLPQPGHKLVQQCFIEEASKLTSSSESSQLRYVVSHTFTLLLLLLVEAKTFGNLDGFWLEVPL